MFITVKNNMTNEKKIIFSVLVFLAISFFFLSFVEWKRTDPTGKNSWWTVYFENPKSSTDLTFTIENRGKAKKLHWKEIVGEDDLILGEADITIPAGQNSTILLPVAQVAQGGRINIEVTDVTGEKKEIYKLIN